VSISSHESKAVLGLFCL